MLKWIWRGSEGSYDYFCLWDIEENAEYFCKTLFLIWWLVVGAV